MRQWMLSNAEEPTARSCMLFAGTISYSKFICLVRLCVFVFVSVCVCVCVSNQLFRGGV